MTYCAIYISWLVTGGSGFIGSNFVRVVRRDDWAMVIILDRLTYAGLADLADDSGHRFYAPHK